MNISFLRLRSALTKESNDMHCVGKRKREPGVFPNDLTVNYKTLTVILPGRLTPTFTNLI